MSNELSSLIMQYRWLQSELGTNATVQGGQRELKINDALGEIFEEIVSFPATDPEINCKQIAILLEAMTKPALKTGDRRVLSNKVLAHVQRLAERVEPQASRRKST